MHPDGHRRNRHRRRDDPVHRDGHLGVHPVRPDDSAGVAALSLDWAGVLRELPDAYRNYRRS